ncbi:MAG: M10 family metallopeptidase [Rhizobiaceae bacterium]|nr:M10 family metallopeptidase [Rhizobiaceae bacterium]
MATPTTNSVPTFKFTPAGSARGLLWGTKWGDGLGDGARLTYSFPSGTATWVRNYGEGEHQSWFSFNATEQAAARAAMATWTQFADLRFSPLPDNRTTVGEFRFAYWNNFGPGVAAHAYFPGDYPEAGDNWYNPNSFNIGRDAIPRGSYDWLTLLHEIGHGLGLKHPFSGTNKLPASLDSYLYTIMSYTASPFADDNFATFYPTTPMYYDLLALQYMYGPNTTVNRGHNVYRFYDGVQYWQTINDSRGTDTMIYVGSENSIIDLRPGKFSFVSEAIFFSGGFNTRGTVTIGPGVVIENARGGSGSDILRGNTAKNVLMGNDGADSLFGYGNDDILYGGWGNDRLVGGPNKDIFVFNTPLDALNNVDSLPDFRPIDDTIRLENAIFTSLSQRGPLHQAFFKRGAAPSDGNDYIIYNPSTGDLSYDQDGSGSTYAPILFARLPTGLAMTYLDFVVI